MSSSIQSVMQENIDFVRDKAHINLDFVYHQMDNLTKLIGNEDFVSQLKDLLNQVLDRNNDGVFNADDVKLLKNIFTKKENQIMNIYNLIMELFNAVLALIASVEKPVLKMDRKAIEGVFFGVFSYVMFQYGAVNEEEKDNVVEIVVTVYNIIQTMDNTLDVSNKLKTLFKKKGWCKCLYSQEAETVELNKEIVRSRNNLKQLSVTVKENQKLNDKVAHLEEKLNRLTKQPVVLETNA